MNAADTRASSAIADCTPEVVVPRSWTTAEIDTFISEVSTTSTNIAMAKRRPRRWLRFAGRVSGLSVAISAAWAEYCPTASSRRDEKQGRWVDKGSPQPGCALRCLRDSQRHPG